MKPKAESYVMKTKDLLPHMVHIYLNVPKYQQFIRNIPDSGFKLDRYPNPISLNDMTMAVKGNAKELNLSNDWALIAYTAYREYYDISAKELFYDKRTRFWGDLKRLAHEGRVGRLIRTLMRKLGFRR